MKRLFYQNLSLVVLLVPIVSACFKSYVSNETPQADANINLVVDGSFEQPDIPTGGVVYQPTGSAWAFLSTGVDGAPGIIDPPGINQYGSFNGYAANDGSQYAFLQSSNDITGVTEINQTITLKVSGTYELSYLEASRSGTNPGGDLTYQVLLDSQVLKKTSTSSGQTFIRKTFRFKVNQGSHLLRFVVPKGQGDNTVFIDRVSLAPAVVK